LRKNPGLIRKDIFVNKQSVGCESRSKSLKMGRGGGSHEAGERRRQYIASLFSGPREKVWEHGNKTRGGKKVVGGTGSL